LGISRKGGEEKSCLLTSDAGYYSELSRCSRGFGGYPLLDLEHAAQKNCFPGSSRSNKMKREGFSLCKTSTFQQIENGLIKPYRTLTITISLVIQKIFSQMLRKVGFESR